METIHKLMNTSGKQDRVLPIAEITNGFKYDGAMNKEGVTINGINYIAKKNKNDRNLNVYCEYIASRFINKMAPIYDNGSALFPEIKAKMNQYLNNRSTFILERCEEKPKSAIRANENDKHGANYYHFINEENLAKYDEMKAIYDLFRKIGMVNIFNAINNACLSEKSGLIPGEYKSFYTEIVCCRYLHLILRVPLDEIRIRLDNGFPWKELI